MQCWRVIEEGKSEEECGVATTRRRRQSGKNRSSQLSLGGGGRREKEDCSQPLPKYAAGRGFFFCRKGFRPVVLLYWIALQYCAADGTWVPLRPFPSLRVSNSVAHSYLRWCRRPDCLLSFFLKPVGTYLGSSVPVPSEPKTPLSLLRLFSVCLFLIPVVPRITSVECLLFEKRHLPGWGY